MLIQNEKDIVALNEYWSSTDHEWLGKKHRINNPRGYVKEPIYTSEALRQKYRAVRLRHINDLLELIYENYLHKKSLLALTEVEDRRLKRYVYSEIILNYPYKCFNTFEPKDATNTKGLDGYMDWVESVLAYRIDSKTGYNTYSKDVELHKKRRQIILQYFVAEIAHFINRIQVEDIKNNIPGSRVYGDNHALSAFLGQHIIRMFPHKEGIQFHSSSITGVKGEKVVYEHWTPISFFRDLIWIHIPQVSGPYVFSSTEWYKILSYAYRTVVVSETEDDDLTAAGFKSKRSFEAYSKVGIEICKEEKKLWKEYHSI
jgi:hypothetical protein